MDRSLLCTGWGSLPPTSIGAAGQFFMASSFMSEAAGAKPLGAGSRDLGQEDRPGSEPPLLHADFDGGASSVARFQANHAAASADFTPRDWKVVGELPDQRAGRAFFAADPNLGTCQPGGDESGVLSLLSPKIRIPASVREPMLSFDHSVATEPGWDGGNLEIRANGGPWQPVEASDFVYNPYNAILFTAAQGNTNPMAGEPAFSGTDGGAVGGAWGRSIVRLAPYARPGDEIELRFAFGSDGCTGRFGWYVDDLLVYRCHAPASGVGAGRRRGPTAPSVAPPVTSAPAQRISGGAPEPGAISKLAR